MTEPPVNPWDMRLRLAADRVLRAVAHHTAPARQAKVALMASAALSIATAVEPTLPNDLLVLEKLLKVGAITALLKDVADDKEPSDAAIATRMEALLPLDRLDELATGQRDLLRALTRQHAWQQQMLRLQEADATTGAALLAAFGEATGDLAFVRDQLAQTATADQVDRLYRLIDTAVIPRLSPSVVAKYNMSGDFRGATLYFESTFNVVPAAPGQVYVPPPLPPPGTLPAPAPLPPGSRLIFQRNNLFTGREAELLDLSGLLRPDRSDAPPTVIATGIGGVGKTQLATEFAYRYGRYFAGGVQWVTLDGDAATIQSEIVDCGAAMGLYDAADTSLTPEQKAARVRQAWRAPTPRLLIFDNCEDAALLDGYVPPPGGARVLVTSRNDTWPRGVAIIHLPTLPRADSVALLREYVGEVTSGGREVTSDELRVTSEELDALAEELGDLPLALILAGSYLAAYPGVTVAGYLAELRRPGLFAHVSLLNRAGEASWTKHDMNAGRTFAVSYARLAPENNATDAAAVRLLAGAACLAPGLPFPRELLTGMFDGVDVDPHLPDDALRRLLALGLLERSGEQLRLHRLIGRFVAESSREGAEEEEGAKEEEEGAGGMAAARGAVEEAVERALDEANNRRDPRSLRGAEVHLRHVVDRAAERDDEGAARLCSKLDYYLDMGGDLRGALPYSRRALAIRERVLGPEHPDTALSLNNLGALLRAQGDLAGARPYYERALAIDEKVLGTEHPDTATDYNNLGYLLQAQGDLAGAQPYFERALAIRERVLGPEHPQTATSLNNLGGLLRAQGDLAGARPYYERALAIWERVLGPEHPDTAQSLNNLGYLLQAQGDLAGARPYYERALAIRERVLGPEHPQTATSLNNLGFLLQAQGDLAGARPYYERALAIDEKVLGTEHPDTAIDYNNLGFLLQAQGDLAGARPYYERALAIRERVLGPEHPDTAQSLNNLGFLLQAQGDLAGARPYYERALAIDEKVLGTDHPDTAIDYNNLGGLLQAQGDLAGARPYYERALAIRERVLGPEHPQTALSLNNLGALLDSQGDLAGARPYFERALAIFTARLGPDHPYTRIVRDNLAALPRE